MYPILDLTLTFPLLNFPLSYVPYGAVGKYRFTNYSHSYGRESLKDHIKTTHTFLPPKLSGTQLYVYIRDLSFGTHYLYCLLNIVAPIIVGSIMIVHQHPLLQV